MTATSWRAAAACFAALLAVGCGQSPAQPEPASLASTVHVRDPKDAGQLVSGFYSIEQDAWRWTGQNFSLLLHPPAGSAHKGAILVFSFIIGEGTIQQLKDITLSASIGGTMLGPQTYTQSGPSTYIRDVPSNVLGSSSVRVDFQLDKVLPPIGRDVRSLGVIAATIGLEPK
jgi:hypothetical protein